MRVTAMTVNEEQELETISVVMSIEEANAIVGVFGKFNGYAMDRMGDVGGVYDSLWSLFCKFYEDGHPTGCPMITTLEGINNP